MQILKRQRELSAVEKQQLKQILEKDELEEPIKVAVNLLLGNTKDVDELLAIMSDKDKNTMKAYPIWKFYEQS